MLHKRNDLAFLEQSTGAWLPESVTVTSLLRMLSANEQFVENVEFQFYSDSDAPEPPQFVAVMVHVPQDSTDFVYFAVSPSVTAWKFRDCFERVFYDIAELKQRNAVMAPIPGRLTKVMAEVQNKLLTSPTAPLALLTDLRVAVEMFYAVETVAKHLTTKQPISIPDGYKFDTLHTDDLKIVVDSYPHAETFVDFSQYVRNKIELFPTLCIRSDDGQLAAFEMIQPPGLLHHLYTEPQFRRKGLATILETEFVRRLLNKSAAVLPHKYVLLSNQAGMTLSLKKQHSLWKSGKDFLYTMSVPLP